MLALVLVWKKQTNANAYLHPYASVNSSNAQPPPTPQLIPGHNPFFFLKKEENGQIPRGGDT